MYLDFLGRSLESYHLSPELFQRFRNRCHKTLGSQMSCWFHLSLSASKEASQCGVLSPSLGLMQYTLWFGSLLKLSCYRFLQLAEGLPRMRRATAFLPLETGWVRATWSSSRVNCLEYYHWYCKSNTGLFHFPFYQFNLIWCYFGIFVYWIANDAPAIE